MIYLIQMSRGENIKIDEEDLAKVKANIKAPLVQIKQAIINPSFMVAIVPTKEPDIAKIPIMERVAENTIAQTGEKEVKVLSDLMGSEIKRLT